MPEEKLVYMNSGEYSIESDPINVKDLSSRGVLTIINLEKDDFSTELGRYTQGNQLIFIERDWARQNLYLIGLLYPTSIVGSVTTHRSTPSWNFNNEDTMSTISRLINTHYLIIPITSISTKPRVLKLSSLKLGNHKLRYRSGNSENNIFINTYEIGIITIFLTGLEINEKNLSLLKTKLDLNIPALSILSTLHEITELYSMNEDYYKVNMSRRYSTNTINRLNTNHRPRVDQEYKNTLFSGAWSSNTYYYVNTVVLLWVLQNELLMFNIQNDMEIG